MSNYNDEEHIQQIADGEKKIKSTIKRLMFDIMTALFVLGMFFLEFGNVIVANKTLLEFLGGFTILFFGAFFIDDNEYVKGSTHGRESKKYKVAVKTCSQIANQLGGDKGTQLGEFCEWFTVKEESRIKRVILRRAGVDYDDYKKCGYEKLTRSEVKKLPDRKKKEKSAIIQANRVNIRQLVETDLLSETGGSTKAQTNLGYTAGQLRARARTSSILARLSTAAIFTYFTVGLAQNISLAAVGWFTLKVAFILFRRITAYYRGYYDITEVVRYRYIRKTDLLKQFDAWGRENYPEMFKDPIEINMADIERELSSELSE